MGITSRCHFHRFSCSVCNRLCFCVDCRAGLSNLAWFNGRYSIDRDPVCSDVDCAFTQTQVNDTDFASQMARAWVRLWVSDWALYL